MPTKNYLILCAVVSIGVALSLLYIPGFSDIVEQVMLGFLATTAS